MEARSELKTWTITQSILSYSQIHSIQTKDRRSTATYVHRRSQIEIILKVVPVLSTRTQRREEGDWSKYSKFSRRSLSPIIKKVTRFFSLLYFCQSVFISWDETMFVGILRTKLFLDLSLLHACFQKSWWDSHGEEEDGSDDVKKNFKKIIMKKLRRGGSPTDHRVGTTSATAYFFFPDVFIP